MNEKNFPLIVKVLDGAVDQSSGVLKERLVNLQIIEFENCFATTLSIHHCVVDAEAYFKFCECWLKIIANGKDSVQDILQSVYVEKKFLENIITSQEPNQYSKDKDMELYSLKYCPDQSWLIELGRALGAAPAVAMLRVLIPTEKIEAVKKQHSADKLKSAFVSTNDVVCSLLWQAFAVARQVADRNAQLVVVSNVRELLCAKEQQDYIGNCVLPVAVNMSGQQLLDADATLVADAVRQRVDLSNNKDRACGAVQWLAHQPRQDMITGLFVNTMRADPSTILVSNWTAFTSSTQQPVPHLLHTQVWGNQHMQSFPGVCVVFERTDAGVVCGVGLLQDNVERFFQSNAMQQCQRL